MSSAETAAKACSHCQDRPESGSAGGKGTSQQDALAQEVTRLKCDKLDLLRQNVVSFLAIYPKVLIVLQFSRIAKNCAYECRSFLYNLMPLVYFLINLFGL